MNKREEKIRELHVQGKTNREIAAELKLTPPGVTHWTNKLGLTPHRTTIRQSLEIIGDKGVCKTCHITKSIDEFGTQTHKGILSYYASCRKCMRKQFQKNINSSIQKFLNYKVWALKCDAKRNNDVFNLSGNSLYPLWEKQKGKCFYTDIELKWKLGKGLHKHVVSVDKIIPEKGYIEGNIVLCTNKANTIKNNLTLDEMKEWMPGWYKRIQRKFKEDET